jgi:competence protein ComEC
MIERGRSRGRAEAWRPWIAAGRRPALAWPHGLTDFVRRAAQRVREWAAVEATPGRLVPWLAIGFGSGTIIYFAVEREPALSAAALVLAATVAAAILCRRRPFAFPACVGVAAVAAGFATGAIKREIIAHPVLSAPAWNVELAGFVEVREERERSDRVVVRLERMSGPRFSEHLERVRVSVR